MPADSTTPFTLVPAVTVNHWEVGFLRIDPDNLVVDISVRYCSKDPATSAITVVRTEVISTDAVPYMVANPTLYSSLKTVAYQILKDLGKMPIDAEVT
jgi:hypothetical protein